MNQKLFRKLCNQYYFEDGIIDLFFACFFGVILILLFPKIPVFVRFFFTTSPIMIMNLRYFVSNNRIGRIKPQQFIKRSDLKNRKLLHLISIYLVTILIPLILLILNVINTYSFMFIMMLGFAFSNVWGSIKKQLAVYHLAIGFLLMTISSTFIIIIKLPVYSYFISLLFSFFFVYFLIIYASKTEPAQNQITFINPIHYFIGFYSIIIAMILITYYFWSSEINSILMPIINHYLHYISWLFFSLCFSVFAKVNQLKRFYLYSFCLALLAIVGIIIKPNQSQLKYYYIIISCIFLAFGLITFSKFLKKYPKLNTQNKTDLKEGELV